MHELTFGQCARNPVRHDSRRPPGSRPDPPGHGLEHPGAAGRAATIEWLEGERVDVAEHGRGDRQSVRIPRATGLSVADISRRMRAPVRAVLPSRRRRRGERVRTPDCRIAEGSPLQRAIAEARLARRRTRRGEPAPARARTALLRPRRLTLSPAWSELRERDLVRRSSRKTTDRHADRQVAVVALDDEGRSAQLSQHGERGGTRNGNVGLR